MQDYFAVLVQPTSQATAEAATNNTEPMTPLRTKQQVTAIGLKPDASKSLTVIGATAVTPTGTSGNLVIIGDLSVQAATSLTDSVFIGTQSGRLATGGNGNVAVGNLTLSSLVSISHSVVIGDAAMKDATAGSSNTVVGYVAATQKLSGSWNVAIGAFCAAYSDTGDYNILIGGYAGAHSVGVATTIGDRNIGIGYTALQYCEGSSNIGLGFETLYSTLGDYNIAIGEECGKILTDAAATGNIFIGRLTGSGAGVQKVDAVNTICIGDGANSTVDNSIVIGNSTTTRAWIRGDLTCGSIDIEANWINTPGPTNGGLWRSGGWLNLTSDTAGIRLNSSTNGRFNAFMYNDGTFVLAPPASAAPVDNGEMTFEFTNNTTLTLKGKGSDGTVRSIALTIA